MATDHPKQVAQYIRGNGLNIPDSDIKAYPVRESPIKAIFCTPTGGASEELGFNSSDTWKYATVQIRVRVPKTDYMEGYQDARDVWDLVQYASPSNYEVWKNQQAQPFFLGPDNDGNFGWSINAELWIIE